MRQFCEPPTRSAAEAGRVTPNRVVADYLAGYAEALADASDRQGGGDD